MTEREQGERTPYDNGWQEGYRAALEYTLGISTADAYSRAVRYWRPRLNWRTKLARLLLRDREVERNVLPKINRAE